MRFVEASLGYPREWQPRDERNGTAVSDLLPRQVLPGPDRAAPATIGPVIAHGRRLPPTGLIRAQCARRPPKDGRSRSAAGRSRSVQRPGRAAELGRGQRCDVDPPEPGWPARRASTITAARTTAGWVIATVCPSAGTVASQSADPGQQLGQPLAAVRRGVRLGQPGLDRGRFGRGDLVERASAPAAEVPVPQRRVGLRRPARARSRSPAGRRRRRSTARSAGRAGRRRPSRAQARPRSSSGSSAGKAVAAVAAVGACETRVRRALTGRRLGRAGSRVASAPTACVELAPTASSEQFCRCPRLILGGSIPMSQAAAVPNATSIPARSRCARSCRGRCSPG